METRTATRPRTADGERGYAMAALIVGIAIMGVMAAMALPVISQSAQREKEAELVFRGEQYARAVGLFQRKMGPGTLPPNLQLLVDQKFLRRKYVDPMTGQEFKPITMAEAMAAGLRGPGAVAGPNGQAQQRPGERLGAFQGATGTSGLGGIPSSPGAGGSLLQGGGLQSGGLQGGGLQSGGLQGGGLQRGGLQGGGGFQGGGFQGGGFPQSGGLQGGGLPQGGLQGGGLPQGGLQGGGRQGGVGTALPGGSGGLPGGQSVPGGPGQPGAPGQGGGPPGGIVGVASTSTLASLRLYNGKDHYNQWAFVYNPPQVAAGGAAGGVQGGAAGGVGPGGVPQGPGQQNGPRAGAPAGPGSPLGSPGGLGGGSRLGSGIGSGLGTSTPRR